VKTEKKEKSFNRGRTDQFIAKNSANNQNTSCTS